MQSNQKTPDYRKLRRYVSNLYIGVLTEKLTVREALAKFPKDCADESIAAAWHALCHLEADEDIRMRDKMYAEEQDNYIEYIAYTLSKGRSLPENIIKSYIPYHENALISPSFSFKGIINTLKKFLCC